MATPQRDPDGNFLGFDGTFCGEHRTVGDHRAWCYACSEWCYPDDGCRGCANASRVGVDRDLLREVRRVLADWRGGPDGQFHASRDLLDRLPDPDEVD